ncbi:MAG: hypothetical protein ACYC9O_15150, partial [Candidatus Latescibacterota bacterium]
MKRMLVFLIMLSLLAVPVMAISFSPTLLKLSAPQQIRYNFDGSTLQVPVSVSGAAAGVILTLFTNDKAATISKVQNGHLGWHYVNKIDTCLYASPVYSLDKGNQNIVWNGKDENGKQVPPGTYTYYLWGWNNVTQKTLAYRGATFNAYPTRGSFIEEIDAKGNPLVNPIFVNAGWGGAQKWVIGSDPNDATMLETTSLTMPAGFDHRQN